MHNRKSSNIRHSKHIQTYSMCTEHVYNSYWNTCSKTNVNNHALYKSSLWKCCLWITKKISTGEKNLQSVQLWLTCCRRTLILTKTAKILNLCVGRFHRNQKISLTKRNILLLFTVNTLIYIALFKNHILVSVHWQEWDI